MIVNKIPSIEQIEAKKIENSAEINKKRKKGIGFFVLSIVFSASSERLVVR
jgi:hypothetical protein